MRVCSVTASPRDLPNSQGCHSWKGGLLWLWIFLHLVLKCFLANSTNAGQHRVTFRGTGMAPRILWKQVSQVIVLWNFAQHLTQGLSEDKASIICGYSLQMIVYWPVTCTFTTQFGKLIRWHCKSLSEEAGEQNKVFYNTWHSRSFCVSYRWFFCANPCRNNRNLWAQP